MIAITNEATIRQHEAREKQIQELKQQVGNEKQKVESKMKEVDALKRQWLSELKVLVQKINDSFSRNFRMFGRGEVRLGLLLCETLFSSQYSIPNSSQDSSFLNQQSGGLGLLPICTGDLGFVS